MSEITQFESSNEGTVPINPIEEDNSTFEIYKGALTFNVLSRYDPSISQLLHISPYCVVYEYVEEDGSWSKAGFQGPLAIYSRGCKWDSMGFGFDKAEFKPHEDDSESQGNKLHIPDESKVSTEDIVKDDSLYKFGLIVLNRLQPENFSIGILGDSFIKSEEVETDRGMFIEVMEEIVIVRDFNGKVWGLWLYDVNDREIVSKLLTYCLKN